MSTIFAHRGASGYAPENTLEAFRLAMEMGADGFELDVHLTRDGELVVIHDETVDRTTNGTGEVRSFTLAELKKLDASNHMEAYRGAKIPTLGEVYALIADTRHIVNVEIKTDNFFYPGIEAKCLALEAEMGMEGRIIYSSFNHYTISRLRELAPDATLGLLYGSILHEPWKYAKTLGAKYLHPYVPNVFVPGLADESNRNGVGLNLWTVNDKEVMQECLKHNVGIITNYPDVAVKLRNEYKA